MSIDEFNNISEGHPEKTRVHHRDAEHALQVTCIKWFRLKYRDTLIWANGNGGKRDAVTGAKMKAEGVLAGVLDLTIAAARKGYHSLYIEMKNGKKGRLSPAQEDMITYLRNHGFKAEVCRTFDEFRNVVEEYM